MRDAWFVAEADDRAAGLAAGRRAGDGAGLLSMWVDPGYRGRGVAGRLVTAVRDWAVAEGARELALWVADGNDAAMRAYARAGFVPTGRRQPLPSDPSVGEEQWVLALAP